MPREPTDFRGAGFEDNFPGADFSEEEIEFMRAMERYKRTRRRPYPTWREVLHVLKELGYRKTPTAPGARPSPSPPRDEGEGRRGRPKTRK